MADLENAVIGILNAMDDQNDEENVPEPPPPLQDRNYVIVDDLIGHIPDPWIDYLRNMLDINRDLVDNFIDYFRKTININGTMDSVTLEAAVINPNPRKRLLVSTILNMRHDDETNSFRDTILQLFRTESIMPLFGGLFFARLIDTVVNAPILSDAQWCIEMASIRHMGRSFTPYCHQIYEKHAGEISTKCCYIMYMDLDLYVFLEGLTIRQQFLLFLAAIIYIGMGEQDEPERKRRTAHQYNNDPDPNKDANPIYRQINLYKRILLHGCHHAYLAENVTASTAAILEAMTINAVDTFKLLANVKLSPGNNMDSFVDEKRHPSIVGGLLVDAFLRKRAEKYGLHSHQLHLQLN